jgi:hypothetical protein
VGPVWDQRLGIVVVLGDVTLDRRLQLPIVSNTPVPEDTRALLAAPRR